MNKPTGKLSVVLFLFAWGFFSVLWSASVIKKGVFYDKGEHADIGSEARPGYFWAVVSLTVLMGLFGLWRGMVELRAYFRQRDAKGAGMMQDLQKHMIKKGRQDDGAA